MALFKSVKRRIPPKGKWQVTMSRDMCKDCQFCIQVCPTDVFRKSETVNRLGWFPIEVADESQCVGCMLCFQLCPDFVIDVVRLE